MHWHQHSHVCLRCVCMSVLRLLPSLHESTWNQANVEWGDIERRSYLKFGEYCSLFKARDLGAPSAHITDLLMKYIQLRVLGWQVNWHVYRPYDNTCVQHNVPQVTFRSTLLRSTTLSIGTFCRFFFFFLAWVHTIVCHKRFQSHYNQPTSILAYARIYVARNRDTCYNIIMKNLSHAYLNIRHII